MTTASWTLQSLLAALPTREAEHIRPFQSRTLQLVAPEAVTGLAYDSRQVQKGNIFVCIKGEHADGHDYIAEAVKAKALAIVVEDISRVPQGLLDTYPILMAKKTYRALAMLASTFYGFPGQQLFMVGVTGTNGKTTVSHLVQEIMAKSGRFEKSGLLGTLGYKGPAGTDYEKTAHTTPMALELQKILSAFYADGYDSLVMEVSSHALEQERVEGCSFDVAVLTNLTQDHLDYHKTMDNYFKAKALLFEGLKPQDDELLRTRARKAVINLDDDYGPAFVAACPSNVSVLTYGLEEKAIANERPLPDVYAKALHYSVHGVQYTCVTPMGELPLQLKIAGQFGVYNSLAAVATGLAMGASLDEIKAALEHVSGVRGRFEVVSESPAVIVDYAHTPDGLSNVLSAAKTVLPTPESRLLVVFGCGGDRDASKRPKMGSIAEKLAHFVVVTSDNPRTEDPQQIISDILTGIESYNPSRIVVEADRRAAIRRAIDEARPQDIVVVAGKGHEDYQILKDETIHFDDREEVLAYLAQRGAAASSS